jgi:hypothetical protein
VKAYIDQPGVFTFANLDCFGCDFHHKIQ